MVLKINLTDYNAALHSLSAYPVNTNICITFVQCWPNVGDVGPTLYKCYTFIALLCVQLNWVDRLTLSNTSRKNRSYKNLFQFQIILHVLFCSFRLMLYVNGHHKCLILSVWVSSLDVRIRRLKTVPALKGLKIY